jgi:uncharacterized RDD family membrane protein YckC
MSALDGGLSIASDTGIDVVLPVAGPGARAFAFLVDWHIRSLLAVAWYASAAVLYNGRLSLAMPPTHDARWFALVVAPAAVIYFLYHYVVELAMRGRTPGKRMAGVRIVARGGGAAGPGALLLRNVFRLIDSLPPFYGVGLVATVVTRDHVRIGDLAAGTLLVYERLQLRAPIASAGSPLDASAVELISELLERWPGLEPAARTQLAQLALKRFDPAHGVPASAEQALRVQLERLIGAQQPSGS